MEQYSLPLNPFYHYWSSIQCPSIVSVVVRLISIHVTTTSHSSTTPPHPSTTPLKYLQPNPSLPTQTQPQQQPHTITSQSSTPFTPRFLGRSVKCWSECTDVDMVIWADFMGWIDARCFAWYVISHHMTFDLSFWTHSPFRRHHHQQYFSISLWWILTHLSYRRHQLSPPPPWCVLPGAVVSVHNIIFGQLATMAFNMRDVGVPEVDATPC